MTAKDAAPAADAAASGSVQARADETDEEFARRLAGGAPAGASAPAAAAAAEPELEGDALEEYLASKWGHWFIFDDSKVTACNVGQLEASFSGSECGYMLMYRARRLMEGAASHSDESKADSASSGAASGAATDEAAGGDAAAPPTLARQPSRQLAQVEPPAYWLDKVRERGGGVGGCGVVAGCLGAHSTTGCSGGGAQQGTRQGTRRVRPRPARNADHCALVRRHRARVASRGR